MVLKIKDNQEVYLLAGKIELGWNKYLLILHEEDICHIGSNKKIMLHRLLRIIIKPLKDLSKTSKTDLKRLINSVLW